MKKTNLIPLLNFFAESLRHLQLKTLNVEIRAPITEGFAEGENCFTEF